MLTGRGIDAMAGCRALTDNEIVKVTDLLKTPRDKALFALGIFSGFRIAELLSLRVNDVYSFGKIVSHVKVERRHMKGKTESRQVPIHPRAREALQALIDSEAPRADFYLFKSRKGFNNPISPCQAWRVLTDAFDLAQLSGQLATHTMRKTFAHKIYNATGKDIRKTQKALGHESLDSTAHYLDASQEDVDAAILGL